MRKPLERVALAIAVTLLLPVSSHALLLCAAVDKVTGEPKDGAVVRLRTACKLKGDGTPAEVALGTSEDLATIGGYQQLATQLSRLDQQRSQTDALVREQLASLDGHLGQFYSVDATGSGQSGNATDAKAAYEALLASLTTEASGVDLFHQAPPASPNSPQTQNAKDKCNVFLQKTIDVTDAMKTDLQIAIALADLSITVFGNTISFGDMLETATIKILEKGKDHLKSQEYQDCADARKQAVQELQNDAQDLPGQYDQEAEETKGQIEGDGEYIEDLDDFIQLVMARLRAIFEDTEQTQRGLILL